MTPTLDSLTINGGPDEFEIIVNQRTFLLYLDSGFWALSEGKRLVENFRKYSRVGAIHKALQLIEKELGINETGRKSKSKG